MTKESKIFMVKNTSLAFPVFYVEAIDILEATKVAKKIVDSINNGRVVGSVSTVDIPLLKWEEE